MTPDFFANEGPNCRFVGTFDLTFRGGRVQSAAKIYTCFFVFLGGT